MVLRRVNAVAVNAPMDLRKGDSITVFAKDFKTKERKQLKARIIKPWRFQPKYPDLWETIKVHTAEFGTVPCIWVEPGEWEFGYNYPVH